MFSLPFSMFFYFINKQDNLAFEERGTCIERKKKKEKKKKRIRNGCLMQILLHSVFGVRRLGNDNCLYADNFSVCF